MDYSPSVSHYLLPVALMIGATAAGYWSFPLMLGLWVVAAVSMSFITYMGKKQADANHLEKVSWIAEKMHLLTYEQQMALRLEVPELRLMFDDASMEAVMTIGDSGVDLEFFIEFMTNKKCNEYHTAPKNDITGNNQETREARRAKWDRLTEYLMSRRLLAAAPAGNETYQWRSGSYLRLWNNYVLPYADLVGRKPVLLAQDKTALYQAEAR